MAIRKSLVVAVGLFLAIAALAPASALAKHEGKVRHVKGHASGVGCNTAGEFSNESTGVGSHIGRFTRTASGTGTLVGETFEGSGTFTVTTPSGATLTGTFTVTGMEGMSTVEATITGGTGRFAGASGEVTEIIHETVISEEGATICASQTGKFSGHVTL